MLFKDSPTSLQSVFRSDRKYWSQQMKTSLGVASHEKTTVIGHEKPKTLASQCGRLCLSIVADTVKKRRQSQP